MERKHYESINQYLYLHTYTFAYIPWIQMVVRLWNKSYNTKHTDKLNSKYWNVPINTYIHNKCNTTYLLKTNILNRFKSHF